MLAKLSAAGLDGASDDDDDFDYEAIATFAVRALERSKAGVAEENKLLEGEIGLDCGCGGNLYFRSQTKRDLDTAAVPNENTLDVKDFANSPALEVLPPSSLELSEVRGAPVRPVNDAALRKKENKQKAKDRLEGWFGLPRQELTPELRSHLIAIKLRGSYDPKRFYKSNDSKELPTHFVIGTEIGGGMAPAGEKATSSRKGKTFLEQILADEKAQEWTSKKAYDIDSRGMAAAQSGHGKVKGKGVKKRGGPWKKMKRGKR